MRHTWKIVLLAGQSHKWSIIRGTLETENEGRNSFVLANTQQAHDIEAISYQRRCNLIMLHGH